MESLTAKIRRVVQEEVAVAPYNPRWPQLFEEEKAQLLTCLPRDLIRRIEHFGSTAVPGLAAKPVVDMLVEVVSLEATRSRIAPILEAQGYDYFWRPTAGDDGPPFYAWFIKRDGCGVRTHHIHMVEREFEHWDRLYFRDYLIARPEVAQDYQALKLRLAAEYPGDRIAYTCGKTAFITRVTAAAKQALACPFGFERAESASAMGERWRQFWWPEWNRRFMIRLAVVAAGAWLLFGQVLLPLRIRGASMEPAYPDGGFNFCFRWRYSSHPPRRFDVVAVRLAGMRVMLLKRVLALPGETVAFQKGRLLVDGQPVAEPQTVLAGGDWELPPRRVAPGRVFVAGDNRSMPIEQHVLGEAALERIAGAPIW